MPPGRVSVEGPFSVIGDVPSAFALVPPARRSRNGVSIKDVIVAAASIVCGKNALVFSAFIVLFLSFDVVITVAIVVMVAVFAWTAAEGSSRFRSRGRSPPNATVAFPRLHPPEWPSATTVATVVTIGSGSFVVGGDVVRSGNACLAGFGAHRWPPPEISGCVAVRRARHALAGFGAQRGSSGETPRPGGPPGTTRTSGSWLDGLVVAAFVAGIIVVIAVAVVVAIAVVRTGLKGNHNWWSKVVRIQRGDAVAQGHFVVLVLALDAGIAIAIVVVATNSPHEFQVLFVLYTVVVVV